MAEPLNALELLRRDHERLKTLVRRFGEDDAEDRQRELCGQIVNELRMHTEIEEQLFYPYLRDSTGREDLFQEATLEHQTMKDLLDRLPKEKPGTPRLRAMVKVLGEYLDLHTQHEEREIFPQVQQTGVDLDALGQALEACRHPDDAAASSSDSGAGRGAGGSTARRDDGSRKDAGAAAKDDERFLKEHGEGLSRSARRAHWIHTPEDKPERDGQTLATRSLEVIRRWAEDRKATPATTPGGDAEHPRVLRFDFPGFDNKLLPVSWEAWGGTFEQRKLVFIFQEKTRDGRQSNFFILDSPDREEG